MDPLIIMSIGVLVVGAIATAMTFGITWLSERNDERREAERNG